MRRITLGIPLALLAIVLATSCSKKDTNTGSEKKPNEVAASQPTTQASPADSRKIKYYKSTMMAGETSKTPGKDSMGMDMVPVYEGTEDTTATSVDAGKKSLTRRWSAKRLLKPWLKARARSNTTNPG